MHLLFKTTSLQPLTKPIAAVIATLMVVASAYLGTQYLGKRAMVTTVLGVEAVGGVWGLGLVASSLVKRTKASKGQVVKVEKGTENV